MTTLWQQPGAGVLSGQVLSEFHWTVTKKLKPGLDDQQARRYVNTLFAWTFVAVDQAAISEAWRVQDRFGFSFWDALIVATARLAGCGVLLTEDLKDDQDLGGLLVVNPFNRPPELFTTTA
jgi:predicted nucleic acid-binding protein